MRTHKVRDMSELLVVELMLCRDVEWPRRDRHVVSLSCFSSLAFSEFFPVPRTSSRVLSNLIYIVE